MSTDADRTPTDQKILPDATPTDRKILGASGFDDGPPTIRMPDRKPLVPTADDEPTTIKESNDGTPTDQKVLLDITPTDQQVVSGSTAVGRGTVIDARWKTERCLASGGYGDVWEAVDLEQPRKVAIKILRTDAGNNDPSAIARMRQEAEILKAITHPNIVAVFGFGSSPYGHFLVMEMLEGRAIDQLLTTQGPIDPAQAIPIVRQLLEALSVAHAQKVFHRDLKPENIIVVKNEDGDDVATLVDFGIAKATQLLSDDEDGATLVQTRAGGFMGTPRYAAPEQAVGDPCGPNIDLFALGLVVAEWLTGRMRIDGERHGDVMQQLLSPDELDISDVPYRWREWLGLMIRKNPRRRLQTATQAIAELERLVVQLHQKPELLDGPQRLAVANSRPKSGFAANDGPLELDFDRAHGVAAASLAGTGAVSHPPRGQMSPHAPMRATPHAPASGHRFTRVERGNSSTGYKISKAIFVLAVGIISFAAFAVLILVLGGMLQP